MVFLSIFLQGLAAVACHMGREKKTGVCKCCVGGSGEEMFPHFMCRSFIEGIMKNFSVRTAQVHYVSSPRAEQGQLLGKS